MKFRQNIDIYVIVIYAKTIFNWSFIFLVINEYSNAGTKVGSFFLVGLVPAPILAIKL